MIYNVLRPKCICCGKIFKRTTSDLLPSSKILHYCSSKCESEGKQEDISRQKQTDSLGKMKAQIVVSTTNSAKEIRKYSKLKDDGSITEVKSNRIKALLEVLDEVEGKVIIWANYVYDIKQIVNAISDEYGDDSIVQYYGAVDAEKRQDNIKKFQDPNSKARFFIGNPQTGGYGITLTAANNVIYYSNGYDLEKRLQSEDRAHRIGQKKAVTYVDLIAPKTVDEKIRKAPVSYTHLTLPTTPYV